MKTRILFSLIIVIFLMGCNGLIYPMAYEVNIRAFDKEGKVVCCDLKTIRKVNKLISKISLKYGFTYSHQSTNKDSKTGKLDPVSCFYRKDDIYTSLFFYYNDFCIVISRRASKEPVHKLGVEILKALEKEFPQYKFKFKAKWIRLSILA